jgi:hypothetical protein
MSSSPEGYLGQGVDPDDHLKTGWGSAPLKFTECTVVFGTHKCSRAECVARGFNKDPPPPTHTHTHTHTRAHTHTRTHARMLEFRLQPTSDAPRGGPTCSSPLMGTSAVNWQGFYHFLLL